MKIAYKNIYDNYDKFFKFKLIRAEKYKYVIALFVFPVLVQSLYQWLIQSLLSSVEILLLFIYGAIPAIIGVFMPKILLIINRVIFKINSNKYELLNTRVLELNEEDKTLILRYSENKYDKFLFRDIKAVIENDNCIYIFRKDKSSFILTPIIPNSAFENEKSREKFLNLLAINKSKHI